MKEVKKSYLNYKLNIARSMIKVIYYFYLFTFALRELIAESFVFFLKADL